MRRRTTHRGASTPSVQSRPGQSPGRLRRHLRRTLPLAGICVAALFTSAAAAADPLINANIITSSGVSTYRVDESSLAGDPSGCPQYDDGQQWSELANSGAEYPSLPSLDWTLETALTCLPGSPIIDPSAITAITVYQSNGVPEDGANSQLSLSDLSVQTDSFQNTSQVPAVGYNQPNVVYNRPMRNGTDLDYQDQVVTPAPLQVDVYETPPLRVTITPTATSITQGQPTGFTATVTDPSNGNQTPPGLQYEWNFEDGLDPSTQASPTVTYPDAGTYTVDLHVTDAAGDGGGTTLNVTIAENKPSTVTQTTTTRSQTGPTHSAGSTNGGGAGKPTRSDGSGNSGATRGAGHRHATHRPKPKPSVAAPTKSAAVTHTATNTAANATTTTPHTSANTTSTTPHPSTGAITTGPTAPAPSSQPIHPSTAKPRHPTQATQPSHRAGKRVSGELIGTVIPATPATISQLEAAATGSRATAPSSRPPQSASALGAIAAVAGVILLLGLGARRELGRRTRPI